MLQTHTSLELHTPETLSSSALYDLGVEIASLSDHLSASYLR